LVALLRMAAMPTAAPVVAGRCKRGPRRAPGLRP
jgi:hypothetical protein